MSRYEPKNREEAFAYQFEDDVKVLHAAAMVGKDEFEKALGTLQIHITTYQSKRMKKYSIKVQKKNEEREEFMKKNYPSLYLKRRGV